MSSKLLDNLPSLHLPKFHLPAPHLPKPHLPELYLPGRQRTQPTSVAANDPTASAADTPVAVALPVRPSHSDLINAESSYGRTLFGPIPLGHRREFFHDRNNVWIWHESWADETGQPQEFTIRYEVRPTGVYKKLAAGQYIQLEGAELENFRLAAHAYLDLIKANLYHRS